MITEEQIKIANTLLATGLVDQVFHSVTLHSDAKEARFPVYKKGAEEFYIGADDRKNRYAYIRQLSPVTTKEEAKESSDRKLYKLSAQCRIVVFKDHEKEDFDSLIQKLLAPVFSQNVLLLSYQHDAFALAKVESPVAEYAFDATTFYLAIDIAVSWWVSFDICDEKCIVYPNPICL